MMRNAGTLALVLVVLVFIISGCIMPGMEKKEWKPTTPQQMHFIHTVRYSGETLRIISKWYTGEEDNWEVLVNANPQIDYDKLVAGKKIFIPENLLKTREPLSKDFIDSYLKKPEPKKIQKETEPSPKPKTPPKKKEEFDLFGPK